MIDDHPALVRGEEGFNEESNIINGDSKMKYADDMSQRSLSVSVTSTLSTKVYFHF